MVVLQERKQAKNNAYQATQQFLMAKASIEFSIIIIVHQIHLPIVQN